MDSNGGNATDVLMHCFVCLWIKCFYDANEIFAWSVVYESERLWVVFRGKVSLWESVGVKDYYGNKLDMSHIRGRECYVQYHWSVGVICIQFPVSHWSVGMAYIKPLASHWSRLYINLLWCFAPRFYVLLWYNLMWISCGGERLSRTDRFHDRSSALFIHHCYCSSYWPYLVAGNVQRMSVDCLAFLTAF